MKYELTQHAPKVMAERGIAIEWMGKNPVSAGVGFAGC